MKTGRDGEGGGKRIPGKSKRKFKSREEGDSVCNERGCVRAAKYRRRKSVEPRVLGGERCGRGDLSQEGTKRGRACPHREKRKKDSEVYIASREKRGEERSVEGERPRTLSCREKRKILILPKGKGVKSIVHSRQIRE